MKEPAEGMRDGLSESLAGLSGQDLVICVKGPGFFPEGPSALERFERRVAEIALAAEIGARDSIPFGLKRRVTLGFPVFDSAQRRGAAALPVPVKQGGQVEGGIRVCREKVPADKPCRRVSQSPRRAEDSLLPENVVLRQVRRAIHQVALDLLAEMMEIDAGFENALAAHRDGRR